MLIFWGCLHSKLMLCNLDRHVIIQSLNSRTIWHFENDTWQVSAAAQDQSGELCNSSWFILVTIASELCSGERTAIKITERANGKLPSLQSCLEKLKPNAKLYSRSQDKDYHLLTSAGHVGVKDIEARADRKLNSVPKTLFLKVLNSISRKAFKVFDFLPLENGHSFFEKYPKLWRTWKWSHSMDQKRLSYLTRNSQMMHSIERAPTLQSWAVPRQYSIWPNAKVFYAHQMF